MSVRDREPALVSGTMVVIGCTSPDDLAEQVAHGFRRGARHIVVDFGDALMVDSTTLTALRRVGLGLRARGGRLSVVCGHPKLASLLHLTLLSHSFRIFGSVDEALQTA